MTEQPPENTSPTPPAPPAYAPFPSSTPGASVPHYPQHQPGPPSKTMAIVALVLAIIPALFTWIAAIVLAIIVLNRSKDGRKHGKGLAISALVISALWIVAIVALIALAVADGADRDDSGKVTGAGSVDVTKVKTGDCVNDAVVGKTNYSVDVVPCNDPHTYEAYANFMLPPGDFPGDKEVSAQAESGCTSRFATYIGVGYDESKLDVTYLHPLKESWDLDRGVTCLVSDGTSTGSLKSAQR